MTDNRLIPTVEKIMWNVNSNDFLIPLQEWMHETD